MTGHDAELELFRDRVNCATLLESLPPPWRLDARQSTRRALKYRRGEGEVLIVNHDGRGWWDPLGAAKGDVFNLVQHLDPSLNFGQLRQVLRRFVGIAPAFRPAASDRKPTEPDASLQERWDRRKRLRAGSPAWDYLAGPRALPAAVLIAAIEADVVREGFQGSAWFAHRDGAAVRHVEVRGPAFKGSLRGGTKTLFRLRGNGNGPKPRLAIAEAPIDALSLAAIEDLRDDTIYAATGGGMGPGTVQAIEQMLAEIASSPAALLASATDANRAGEAFAARHADLAAAAGVAFARLMPTVGTDWNDTLKG